MFASLKIALEKTRRLKKKKTKRGLSTTRAFLHHYSNKSAIPFKLPVQSYFVKCCLLAKFMTKDYANTVDLQRLFGVLKTGSVSVTFLENNFDKRAEQRPVEVEKTRLNNSDFIDLQFHALLYTFENCF